MRNSGLRLAVLFAVALPFVGAAPYATAEVDAPLYQVEVVIFSQPTGTSLERPPLRQPQPQPPEAESTPQLTLDPGMEEAPGADASPTVEEGLPILPESLSIPTRPLQLAAVAARLNTGGYRLLWHQAWVQSPLSGVGLDLATLAALGRGPAVPGLSGSISLTAGRFLHLGMGIELQSPSGLEALMQQQRRVRAGVEQYFDHPRIGIVALVTPIESGEDSAQSAP